MAAGSYEVLNGNDCASVVPKRSMPREKAPDSLPEHFFDLPDLFFNFADIAFGFTLSL